MTTRSRLFCALAALAAAVSTGSLRGESAAPGLALVAPNPSASDNGAAGPLVLAPVRPNVSLTTNALLGFVNSQPVFVQDMFRPIDGDLRGLANQAHSITEFREAARAAIEKQMRAYVYEMVMMSAAKSNLSDEDKQRVDIYLRIQRSETISKYGGSLAMADQALRATGSSVDKKMEDLRREMIVQLYMHKELYPRIVVTRQMVMDEYERSASKQEDAEVELFTITLPLTRWLREPGTGGKKGPVMTNPTPEQIRDAEKQAVATAKEIAEKVRAGADFASLAEDYSSADQRANYGGYWPSVKHNGSLNPKIENYAFSLPGNTVGDPLLLTNDDFHKSAVVVLKVGKKKESRVVPFSEAQDSIRDSLRTRQLTKLQNTYMDKLIKGSAVEAVERMTDVALDAAVARYATQ